jgi:hypothetical protein
VLVSGSPGDLCLLALEVASILDCGFERLHVQTTDRPIEVKSVLREIRQPRLRLPKPLLSGNSPAMSFSNRGGTQPANVSFEPGTAV